MLERAVVKAILSVRQSVWHTGDRRLNSLRYRFFASYDRCC